MAAVDVCNLALVKLGDPEQLSSLTQGGKTATLFNTHYLPVLRAELRKHIWSFAKEQVSLAADATEPTFGYDYRYLLPADFIRLGKNPDADDWDIKGRYLYTDDAAPLELEYVALKEDTDEWDALFYQTVATALAVTIAPWRTAATTKKQDLKEDYREILAEARRINAFDLEPEEGPEDSWVTARYS